MGVGWGGSARKGNERISAEVRGWARDYRGARCTRTSCRRGAKREGGREREGGGEGIRETHAATRSRFTFRLRRFNSACSHPANNCSTDNMQKHATPLARELRFFPSEFRDDRSLQTLSSRPRAQHAHASYALLTRRSRSQMHLRPTSATPCESVRRRSCARFAPPTSGGGGGKEEVGTTGLLARAAARMCGVRQRAGTHAWRE